MVVPYDERLTQSSLSSSSSSSSLSSSLSVSNSSSNLSLSDNDTSDFSQSPSSCYVSDSESDFNLNSVSDLSLINLSPSSSSSSLSLSISSKNSTANLSAKTLSYYLLQKHDVEILSLIKDLSLFIFEEDATKMIKDVSWYLMAAIDTSDLNANPKLAGFILYKEISKPERMIEISKIAVNPLYRKMGVGKQLVGKVLHFARANPGIQSYENAPQFGVSEISVGSCHERVKRGVTPMVCLWAFTSAVKFYQNLRFETHEVHEGTDDHADQIFMEMRVAVKKGMKASSAKNSPLPKKNRNKGKKGRR